MDKKVLLNSSCRMRWTALSLTSVTMLAAYFMTDVMSPLKPMLEKELNWGSLDYGWFTSAYGWFNVFLLMLLFGGLILDRFGIRLTGKGAALCMVAGATLKYWAVMTVFPEGATLLGMKTQVTVAALGFALFGVGAEVAGITVTKIIVKWFKGYEMATAMGLQMAVARIGTLFALSVSAPIATYFSGQVSAAVLLGLILLCIGLITFMIYAVYDKKLDDSHSVADEEEQSDFRLSDISVIVKNSGFWLLTVLCVLFYSCVFPFLKYSTDLMVNKFHVDENMAGIISGLLPFGTLVLTPFFGSIFDKKGKGATIMLIGAFLLVIVHGIFSIPAFDSWLLAITLMIVLGIAFSLVPSAIWPSVAKIIPEKQLGTAYSLIFYIQNIGLMGVPYLIGWLLENHCITGEFMGIKHYDYTIPMIFFTGLALLSVFVAYWLKRVNIKKGYGLEIPNIQRKEA